MIKWIYNLGIQHERRRIKLLIERYLNDSQDDLELWRVEPKTTEQKLKQIAVTEKARITLLKLLEPKGEWVTQGKAPIDDQLRENK